MNDALDTMDKYLPSDYDGDLDTLRTAFGQFTDALAGVDLSDPPEGVRPSELLASFPVLTGEERTFGKC
mgnify:CR=1 FL=1